MAPPSRLPREGCLAMADVAGGDDIAAIEEVVTVDVVVALAPASQVVAPMMSLIQRGLM